MRRAAVSIVSNIAEGFSRNSPKEKIQFYAIAKGSNTELQSQLLVVRDIGYLDKILFDKIAERTIQASRLMTGLIRKCKTD
jgi:four helix bundle protein